MKSFLFRTLECGQFDYNPASPVLLRNVGMKRTIFKLLKVFSLILQVGPGLRAKGVDDGRRLHEHGE